MKHSSLRALLSLLSVVALGLLACSLPPANNPRAVADLFLNQLRAAEFKQAGELATDSSRQILLYLESLKSSLPQERIDQSRAKNVSIIKVQEEGEVARVHYRLGTDDEQVLELVKVAGVWKVDFKKQL